MDIISTFCIHLYPFMAFCSFDYYETINNTDTNTKAATEIRDSSIDRRHFIKSIYCHNYLDNSFFFLAITTLWITRKRQSIAAIVIPVHHA